jgi:hypothetical protein
MRWCVCFFNCIIVKLCTIITCVLIKSVKYCFITLRWDFNNVALFGVKGFAGLKWCDLIVDSCFFYFFYFFLCFLFLNIIRILNKKIFSKHPVKINLSGQFFIFRYDSTRFIINLQMWGNDVTSTCFYSANIQTRPHLLICRNRWLSDLNFVIIRLMLLFKGRKFAD